MAARVYEHQGIARLHVDLNSPLSAFNRPAATLAPDIFLSPEKRWMNDVGLVRARNDHRAAVSWTNIGECNQHIDLTAHEASIVIPILESFAAIVAPAVERDCFTWTTDVEEVLVDEQRTMIIVERALSTDKPQDIVDVAGMIDELLKRLASLIDLLVANPPVLRMVLTVNIAVPAVARQRPRDTVNASITGGDFLRSERVTQKHEALKVKQVLLSVSGNAGVRKADLQGGDMVSRVYKSHQDEEPSLAYFNSVYSDTASYNDRLH